MFERFVSSFGGGGELVKDSDSPAHGMGADGGVEVYLALHDNNYVRYERNLGENALEVLWRARTSNGHIYEFGDAGNASHAYHRAPLSREIDAFGHVIEYNWNEATFIAEGSTATELVLDNVLYKTELGEIYVRIDLNYSSQSCNGFPVGARLDYHYEVPQLHGSRRLDSIEIKARRLTQDTGPLTLDNDLSDVRRYDLSYSNDTQACDHNFGAPVRQLASIQETGYAPLTQAPTSLPPTRFAYGTFEPAKDVEYVAAPVSNFFLPDGIDSADGPGLSRTWLDANGDGIPDRISRMIGNNANAPLKVAYSDGNGGVASQVDHDLPTFLPSVFGQDVSLGLSGNIRKFTEGDGTPLGNCPGMFPVGSFEYYGFIDVRP